MNNGTCVKYANRPCTIQKYAHANALPSAAMTAYGHILKTKEFFHAAGQKTCSCEINSPLKKNSLIKILCSWDAQKNIVSISTILYSLMRT